MPWAERGGDERQQIIGEATSLWSEAISPRAEDCAVNIALSAPPTVAATVPPRAHKPPPSKSYLPTFIAPEAYGKKSTGGLPPRLKKHEGLAKVEQAKKERRKLASRQKPEPRASEVNQEATGLEIFCIVATGLAFALFEALDVDVLIGLLLMPVRVRPRSRMECISTRSPARLWLAHTLQTKRSCSLSICVMCPLSLPSPVR